jgi:BlaI family transcriptional regulator, penicillinase repressor
MMNPRGELTEAQLELMEVVWNAGGEGASVGEIWESIAATRTVARTTVLTMVARLEERGWLKRRLGQKVIRYVASKPRSLAIGRLSRRFLAHFFDGSPSAFLKSLLGSEPIDPEELARIRRLLDESDQADQGRVKPS